MTFQEFFQELELDSFGLDGFAWILDAPEDTFQAMKDTLYDSLKQDITNGNFLNEISNAEDLDIATLKSEMILMYNTFEELLEENTYDLPQDRVKFFLKLLALLRDSSLELPDRKTIEVIVEKMDDGVILPTYAHNTDAGADIHANEEVEIPGNTTVIVKTGIKVAIPVGWELQVRPRSGMSAKTPIRVANAPGTIDTGYRDEIGVICHNTSPYPYTIHKGDRIAQLVLAQSPMITWVEDKVNKVEGNRLGGFGSTGK